MEECVDKTMRGVGCGYGVMQEWVVWSAPCISQLLVSHRYPAVPQIIIR